jgi:ABC-type nitrate/sulfonate/bicarbonate transport system ATPase subunit
MKTSAPVLSLNAVGYRYGNGLLAVEDVDLHVGPSEIVALVGPSGSGKSTLLNIVAGLRRPTSGHVFVRDEELSNRLGHFSYMPQRDLLLPWRSALDNAGLTLEVRGSSRSDARKKAMTVLGEFGLAGFAGSRPAELSGGMRQRIALVRTFLPNQDVLLDEPFGALDAITRGDLQEWLLKLHAVTPRSVLLVTHDLEEAVFLADRVYMLSPRPGRILTELRVDLPRPRTLEITTTAEFSALKFALMLTLRSGRERETAIT